jgi:hypothetical protein
MQLVFRKILFHFTCLLALISCDVEHSTTEIFWINSERVPCVGLFEQTCYLVQKQEQLGVEWELFYDPIIGFTEVYEEGFIYKIKVHVEEVDNPAADASSFQYVLLEILSIQ